MSELDFERLLAANKAQYEKDFNEAEDFSTWMPKDGDYIVVVTKCAPSTFTKKDATIPTLRWKLTMDIQAGDNPELYGESFDVSFRTDVPGILKREAKALKKTNTITFDEAIEEIKAAVGKVLRVKISTSTSSKNGQEYTNCYIQEVIQTEVAEDLPEEPPQGDQTAEAAGQAAPDA